MSRITLYFAPRTRALRALWMLEELGVKYTLVPVDFAHGGHKSAEMLALNPMGKLPIVTVDGHAVWESPAIIAHLCDICPEAGLAPKVASAARADFYRWLSFGTAVMEPAFMDHMKKTQVDPSQAGWGDFATMKAALATGLDEGDWILGRDFSGADVMIGGNLDWFTQWAAEAFADVAGLEAYVARIRARPALIRARQIDADLAARQTAS